MSFFFVFFFCSAFLALLVLQSKISRPLDTPSDWGEAVQRHSSLVLSDSHLHLSIFCPSRGIPHAPALFY